MTRIAYEAPLDEGEWQSLLADFAANTVDPTRPAVPADKGSALSQLAKLCRNAEIGIVNTEMRFGFVVDSAAAVCVLDFDDGYSETGAQLLRPPMSEADLKAAYTDRQSQIEEFLLFSDPPTGENAARLLGFSYPGGVITEMRVPWIERTGARIVTGDCASFLLRLNDKATPGIVCRDNGNIVYSSIGAARTAHAALSPSGRTLLRLTGDHLELWDAVSAKRLLSISADGYSARVDWLTEEQILIRGDREPAEVHTTVGKKVVAAECGGRPIEIISVRHEARTRTASVLNPQGREFSFDHVRSCFVSP